MCDTKECKSCGEYIKQSASICIHCNTYQNWRRFLVIGNISLTLLIAFLSVASITIPVIKKVFTKNDSNLSIVYLDSEKDKISLLASNKGILPGAIISADIKLDKRVYSLPIEGGAILIDKSSSKIVNIVTKEAVNSFYTEISLGSEYKSSVSIDSMCSLIVYIKSFSGKNKKEFFNEKCTDFLVK